MLVEAESYLARPRCGERSPNTWNITTRNVITRANTICCCSPNRADLQRDQRYASENVSGAYSATTAEPHEYFDHTGSINGPNNPAKLGSIVVVWANGAGLLDPLPTDGSITGTLLAKPVLPVSVTYGGPRCDILYAGAAPGLVAGVLQVNARLPTGAVALNDAIQVKIGEAIGGAPIYTSLP